MDQIDLLHPNSPLDSLSHSHSVSCSLILTNTSSHLSDSLSLESYIVHTHSQTFSVSWSHSLLLSRALSHSFAILFASQSHLCQCVNIIVSRRNFSSLRFFKKYMEYFKRWWVSWFMICMLWSMEKLCVKFVWMFHLNMRNFFKVSYWNPKLV